MARNDVFTRSTLVAAACLLAGPIAVVGQTPETGRTGRQVYESICITCHGPDGRGGVNPALEQIIPMPDFTDCGFANREPDRGFVAVAHNGGPARGFSPLMAPWGAAFTERELALAVGHLRTLCTDQRWPRGELNLPRPLVTAKAFPEDEAVVSTTAQSGSVVTKFDLRAALRPAEPVRGDPADRVRRRTATTGAPPASATSPWSTSARSRTASRAATSSASPASSSCRPATRTRDSAAAPLSSSPSSRSVRCCRDSFVQAQAGFGIPDGERPRQRGVLARRRGRRRSNSVDSAGSGRRCSRSWRRGPS